MDARVERLIRELDMWCCKGRAALENRDIPPSCVPFKFYMEQELEGVSLVQESMRETELLYCLDYWCRQPGAFSRLWPNADPITAKEAKRWFMARTAVLLGKIRLDDRTIRE